MNLVIGAGSVVIAGLRRVNLDGDAGQGERSAVNPRGRQVGNPRLPEVVWMQAGSVCANASTPDVICEAANASELTGMRARASIPDVILPADRFGIRAVLKPCQR